MTVCPGYGVAGVCRDCDGRGRDGSPIGRWDPNAWDDDLCLTCWGDGATTCTCTPDDPENPNCGTCRH